MHTFQDLSITRIALKATGIFVNATYEGWNSGYSFFVEFSGRVRGMVDSGEWYELTATSASFIRQKVISILGEHAELLVGS